MGEFVVLAVLAAVVALAIRSVCRGHKKGGCGGDCSSCHGCGR